MQFPQSFFYIFRSRRIDFQFTKGQMGVTTEMNEEFKYCRIHLIQWIRGNKRVIRWTSHLLGNSTLAAYSLYSRNGTTGAPSGRSAWYALRDVCSSANASWNEYYYWFCHEPLLYSSIFQKLTDISLTLHSVATLISIASIFDLSIFICRWWEFDLRLKSRTHIEHFPRILNKWIRRREWTDW